MRPSPPPSAGDDGVADVGRRVRSQEGDRLSYFVWLADATGGDPGEHLVAD